MQQNPPATSAPTTLGAAPNGVATEPDLDVDPALSLWRRCWHWLADLLARAEQRVTENFRVPPGGG